MSVLDRFINAMKLNDDDYDDDYEGFYDDEDEPEEVKKPAPKPAMKNDDLEPAKPSRVTSIRSASRGSRMLPSGMEVCVIKPTAVDDAREITDTLLANRTVVLNLEGLDVDIAQRIIDFTSGSTYAMSGNLQKISHYIFIITPKSVDISGDFTEGVLTGGFDVPSAMSNTF